MHDRCTCAHDQGLARAQAGEPGKAYCDMPPWARCRDREFPVTIEKASLVS